MLCTFFFCCCSRQVARLQKQLADATKRGDEFERIVNKRVNEGQTPGGGGGGGGDTSAAGGAHRKLVRIYFDGVFDMMHFGHGNALRQARQVGDVLVVGLVGDEDVIKNKGAPPVMSYDERRTALLGCKWVDEIVDHAPYDVTPEWTETLFTEYDIDFVVHGDDPCITADGKDAYETAKKWGRFRAIKRTEGVSTTDIVGRMLLGTRDHHVRYGATTPPPAAQTPQQRVDAEEREVAQRRRSMSHDFDRLARHPDGGRDRQTAMRHFLPTSRRLMQFAEGKSPKPDDTIVYICGAFDCFNAGHVDALKKAREYGDFLLVGVHDDDTVNAKRGSMFPIMNLHERVLSVLSCKYVDEVIIGAPWIITRDMITTMNIKVVVYGTHHEGEGGPGGAADNASVRLEEGGGPPYAVPFAMGILKQFQSPRPLGVDDIINRIMANRERFAKKVAKSLKKEESYYEGSKKYVPEL